MGPLLISVMSVEEDARFGVGLHSRHHHGSLSMSPASSAEGTSKEQDTGASRLPEKQIRDPLSGIMSCGRL